MILRRLTRTLLPIVVMAMLPPVVLHAGELKVDSFFPAGVQRGQTVSIEVGGKFAHWPVKLWVDRDDVTAQAAKEKGRLRVTAAAEATPGVVWIRLFDQQGAAKAQPLVIGTLPEMLETEPNDDSRSPQQLEFARRVVNGRLAKAGDVDTFAVALRAGDRLVASIEANRSLGSPMDAVLQVVDSRGFVLAHNDDSTGLDPRIVFDATQDDTYRVRVFAFPAKPNQSIRFAGGATYIYRLTLTNGPFIDRARPLAIQAGKPTTIELLGWNLPEPRRVERSADLPGQAIMAFDAEAGGRAEIAVVESGVTVEGEANSQNKPTTAVPSTISGTIGSPREEDVFRFAGTKGQTLRFGVRSRSLGYPLDPVLKILSAEGKTLKEVDDTTGRDAAFPYTLPADGEYQLAVRDLYVRGGARFAYLLSINEVRPDFRLSLPAESYVLTVGKPLEIPVTVAREGGLAADIEITAGGLPAGVTAAAAASAKQGDSSKQVKLVLSAKSAGFSGPIRIEGQTRQQPAIRHAATAALKVTPATTQVIWLSVVAAKPSSNAK